MKIGALPVVFLRTSYYVMLIKNKLNNYHNAQVSIWAGKSKTYQLTFHQLTRTKHCPICLHIGHYLPSFQKDWITELKIMSSAASLVCVQSEQRKDQGSFNVNLLTDILVFHITVILPHIAYTKLHHNHIKVSSSYTKLYTAQNRS